MTTDLWQGTQYIWFFFFFFFFFFLETNCKVVCWAKHVHNLSGEGDKAGNFTSWVLGCKNWRLGPCFRGPYSWSIPSWLDREIFSNTKYLFPISEPYERPSTGNWNKYEIFVKQIANTKGNLNIVKCIDPNPSSTGKTGHSQFTQGE